MTVLNDQYDSNMEWKKAWSMHVLVNSDVAGHAEWMSEEQLTKWGYDGNVVSKWGSWGKMERTNG